MSRDEELMSQALSEAARAAAEGEVPVGCVIVGETGVELARGYNQREQRNDVSAHAELVALRSAAARSGSWRCPGATVYVTLEPCVMCAGALVQARVARLVYGCDDPKGGGLFSLYKIGDDPRLNHKMEVVRGVEAGACAEALREFFGRLRRMGKK